MFEINFRSFLWELNASKFLVYACLLIFSMLLALRLDQVITVNYAVVFLPLWLGEACVFAGFIVGFISFVLHPPSRTDIIHSFAVPPPPSSPPSPPTLPPIEKQPRRPPPAIAVAN